MDGRRQTVDGGWDGGRRSPTRVTALARKELPHDAIERWHGLSVTAIPCEPMHPYQRLVVWQRAHSLTASLYIDGVLDESPKYRSLVDQIRRSAGSIGANIAEGAGAGSQTDFGRYLGIALKSAYELESHFLLAHVVGCISSSKAGEFAEQIQSLKRMLTVLRARVRAPRGQHKRGNGGPQ